MNISLLFPPSWHPSQPYLSIPCLSAFLENSGVPVQQQRDLNIELLDRMLTKSFGLDIHQQLIDLVRKLEQSVSGETGHGSKEHFHSPGVMLLTPVACFSTNSNNRLVEKQATGVRSITPGLWNPWTDFLPSLMKWSPPKCRCVGRAFLT